MLSRHQQRLLRQLRRRWPAAGSSASKVCQLGRLIQRHQANRAEPEAPLRTRGVEPDTSCLPIDTLRRFIHG